MASGDSGTTAGLRRTNSAAAHRVSKRYLELGT